jgi:hypothetical protein
VVSDESELERLRREAEELRTLVRDLSARHAAVVSALPLEAALAFAKGATLPERNFRLENWKETSEMTPADVASEMALLWRRLPPREGA